jgi:hypothetical protein
MCAGRVGEYRSCAKSSGKGVSPVAPVLLVVNGAPFEEDVSGETLGVKGKNGEKEIKMDSR